jgi:UDP-N-acetylglucosamine--N-acetylmuramyl-(pentapeptide) pyrophosphoryl-undecaprenol N-acetylglucosamine transferase
VPETILLSAGGTGGHLFPAEALAQELLARGRRVVIVTDKRGHAFKSLSGDVRVHTVRAATLKPGIVNKIRAVAEMGIGIMQSAFLLLREKPACVVGFGGYPSFPAVFAAQVLGLPTILHEQNAVLGKANVMLAPRSVLIAESLPGTRGIKAGWKDKTVTTGNPVRAAIVGVRGRAYVPPDREFRILVTGGSQAASVFGEIVPQALGLLPPDMKARLSVVHQSKESETPQTLEKYQAAGIRAEVRPFFSDMAERLSSCHLFIGRSGASTVAELAAAGVPAILVPYPGHADMQQKHNAEALTARGGARLMMQPDFTPAALGQKVREMMENPAMLRNAAAAAKDCGRPDAAQRLADCVEKRILTA